MFNKKLFDNEVAVFSSVMDQMDNTLFFPWEAQETFQKNWDLNAMDFLTMFDKSMAIGTDKWSLSFIPGINRMKQFIQINEDMVRGMYEDLYSDHRDLAGRIGRYEYHCDLLLDQLKETHPLELDHFHSNKIMIFHYLSMRFPKLYTHWQISEMKKVLAKCGAPKPLENHEVERYVKTSRIFHKFLESNQDVIAALSSRINQSQLETSPMALTYLFINSCSK